MKEELDRDDVYDWIDNKFGPEILTMSLDILPTHYKHQRNAAQFALDQGPTNKILNIIQARFDQLGVSEQEVERLLEQRKEDEINRAVQEYEEQNKNSSL